MRRWGKPPFPLRWTVCGRLPHVTATLIRIGAAFALVAGLVSLGAPFTTGCGTQCERNPNEAPVPFDAGNTTNPGTPYASYESSGWDGPYLDFPPGRTYRFMHHLGDCPKSIEVWGSFNNREPVVATHEKTKPMGGSAEIVGNQATVERVTSTAIEIRNDTCSDVLIRVVASEPGSSHCTPAPPSVRDAAPDAP